MIYDLLYETGLIVRVNLADEEALALRAQWEEVLNPMSDYPANPLFTQARTLVNLHGLQVIRPDSIDLTAKG